MDRGLSYLLQLMHVCIYSNTHCIFKLITLVTEPWLLQMNTNDLKFRATQGPNVLLLKAESSSGAVGKPSSPISAWSQLWLLFHRWFKSADRDHSGLFHLYILLQELWRIFQKTTSKLGFYARTIKFFWTVLQVRVRLIIIINNNNNTYNVHLQEKLKKT